MNNPTFFYGLLFFLLIFTSLCEIIARADKVDAALYIVYLGHKPHDDHELITDSHHDILGQVIGSKEEAKKHMVYSYRYGFSGFAAKLTDSQAKQIRELPDVIHVIKNSIYQPRTSRSWNLLGLSRNNPNNLLNKSNEGDGIIIGIIDSGIYADSKAFNDKGLGPIPSRWKHRCISEGLFNAAKHCNKKIIGARWYMKGLMNSGLNQTEIEKLYDLSPLDDGGHGTHVAYTAAGSYVNNVQYNGLNMGTTRGGAPRARLAIYKVCWSDKGLGGGCAAVDILAAIDDAIKDGVDIISASIGHPDRLYSEAVFHTSLDLGSFHAVSRGISFVASGGNEGPEPNTITNVSPWTLNVAASSEDRDILTPLTLGNNKTIQAGQAVFKSKDQAFVPLLVNRGITNNEGIASIADEVKGKVLVLFLDDKTDIAPYLLTLNTTGVLALIGVTSVPDQITDFNRLIGVPIPYFTVTLEQGNQILDYFQQCTSNNQDPIIKLGQSEVIQGNEISLKVAKFSSRGPNSFAPEILKPDVAAPGVNILAAAPPSFGENGFQFLAGTSMSAPHVSGIVALLKVKHPNWSPAAIKSALVTTAWNEDTYKSEIYSEGTGNHLANPFDFGGGVCNPNGAMDPGLIYDMDRNDYLNYLCSLGYNNNMVHNATAYFFDKKNSTICPKEVPSRLDLNLPSISIPSLRNSVIVKRTVTNVGNVNSIYKLVVKPPKNTAIKVSPNVLKFNSKTKKISFKVKIISTYQRRSKFNFGSLAWTDGKHFVRIPIAVRR